jgi:hypothetical protein
MRLRDAEIGLEVLEEFAEAQGKMVIKPGALGYIPGDVLRQPQDSHVRAWRERNLLLGLCRSCSRPRDGSSLVYCRLHRIQRNKRMERKRRALGVRDSGRRWSWYRDDHADVEPLKPNLNIGAIGRDPPGYGGCARLVALRNGCEEAEADIRRELQVAYEQGRTDAWKEQPDE